MIDVAGHTSQKVTFYITKYNVGVTKVSVNGLTGTFTAEEHAEPSPTPIEAPPVPSEPSPAPTEPASAPVPPAFNWWLIGGLILAVIAIGMVVYKVMGPRIIRY